ncbi:zinc finger protein 155-like [Wyeomyia smithii]|uniref:zinc finger protein 155-like n=1 Tax=Wyeomyia smithii TaxID=174621 RepID=UPI002467ECEB|nr:zinc finger protein 155-like [Wyeomyia smithii]
MSVKEEKVCRLCMSRTNVVHTLLEDNLLQKVAICVSLLIKPDDTILPLDICVLCTLKVKDFFEFRQNCLKVQQLFEQSQASELEEKSCPPSKLVEPRIEKCNYVELEESTKISKLEVEFDRSVDHEHLDEYELLYEEEMAPEFAELEDDSEEQTENILDEQEKVLLDIEESVDSDNDNHQHFEVEVLEVHQVKSPLQSACKEESSVPPVQQIDFIEEAETDTYTVPKRGSVRKKQNTELGPKRDEKEIYRSLLKKCETCGKLVERNRLEGHLNRHVNIRPYECGAPDCKRKFHCKIALRLHTRGRHSDKRLPCDLCGKVYSSTKTLYHHKKETHSERRFKCELCELCFVSNARLNRHMMTHSDTFEFKCPHCPKEFYRSNNLKVHLRSHTKEKPFACSACDKAFGYQRLLRDHVARHHS